jgi:hypothetical protein
MSARRSRSAGQVLYFSKVALKPPPWFWSMWVRNCVYGPALELSDKISLGGPLAFVQISPASKIFAVGVIHERHTREIHRQLEEAEARRAGRRCRNFDC